jgi:hypothetical protein
MVIPPATVEGLNGQAFGGPRPRPNPPIALSATHEGARPGAEFQLTIG